MVRFNTNFIIMVAYIHNNSSFPGAQGQTAHENEQHTMLIERNSMIRTKADTAMVKTNTYRLEHLIRTMKYARSPGFNIFKYLFVCYTPSATQSIRVGTQSIANT